MCNARQQAKPQDLLYRFRRCAQASSRAKMRIMAHIYLDHAASTPLDQAALEAMLPYFSEDYGNPSSVHYFGQRAEAAVEAARETMADCLGASPSEIIFTACASESDNIAIRGAAFSARERRGANHILTTPVEHAAVRKTVQQLEELHGFEVEFLPVDEHGRLPPDELRSHIRPDTIIASIIFANNEIGTINPIPELAAVCRQQGVLFHTDAVQAASQIGINLGELDVDLLSLGGHKFYGPKVVGALYVRQGTPLIPPITGGGQECGIRPGTHNVPLIVGMARALEITKQGMDQYNAHFVELRDRVIDGLTRLVPDCKLTGHPRQRLPNHASFVFRNVDGNQLLAALDLAGFACSSGSACKTGLPEPSECLLALGLGREWAMGSLRVTVGRHTRQEDITAFLEAVPRIIERLRSSARSGVQP
jgi:cysteine desulfurase